MRLQRYISHACTMYVPLVQHTYIARYWYRGTDVACVLVLCYTELLPIPLSSWLLLRPSVSGSRPLSTPSCLATYAQPTLFPPFTSEAPLRCSAALCCRRNVERYLQAREQAVGRAAQAIRKQVSLVKQHHNTTALASPHLCPRFRWCKCARSIHLPGDWLSSTSRSHRHRRVHRCGVRHGRRRDTTALVGWLHWPLGSQACWLPFLSSVTNTQRCTS